MPNSGVLPLQDNFFFCKSIVINKEKYVLMLLFNCILTNENDRFIILVNVNKKGILMARHKEYNREEVLDNATRVFWEKGYTGTSVNALVQATGLGKRSMYQEFGSKENLFRECLQNYMLNLNREAGTILLREPQGLENIEAFFLNRIDYATLQDCNGCMVINSAIEKELLDAKAFSMTHQALSGQEDAFYQCLNAAQDKGEIPTGKDLKALAGFLMTFTAGMMVMCKTGPKRKDMIANTETALSIIKN